MKRFVLTFIIVLLSISTSLAASINVTWPRNAILDDVIKYTIYMRSDNTNGIGFVKGQDIVGTVTAVSGVVSTSFSINSAPNSQSNCVRITATDSEGYESDFSLPSYIDTAPPLKVGNPAVKVLRTTSKNSRNFYITWPKNSLSDGVAKYNIYMRSNNSDGSGFVKGTNIIGTVNGSTLKYSYTFKCGVLKCPSNYCVRITAVDFSGNESEFSNPAYAIP